MRAGYEGRGPGPDNAKTILMLSSILDNYPEALCKQSILKISQNSLKNTCIGVSFLIKACNFIKKTSGTGVFLWILRNF